MCGIFGFISKKPRPFNKRAFYCMGVRNDTRGGDSCGVFIDGQVDYGVDKKKLFLNFFRESLLLNATQECKIALGHCRKASVGKVSIETAQPVVLTNEAGDVEFVLIHNGTIYNYEELAKKYIPDVDIKGLTDSQVMARIFYHKGYDCLDEYYGGAVFVIHDYRNGNSYIFKGHSKKFNYEQSVEEEERPLFYCWHNGRFCFSSIAETLYAFYYEEECYIMPHNKLMLVKGDKLKLVKEYKRKNVSQSKPVVVFKGNMVVWDDDDEHFYHKNSQGGYYDYAENRSFKIGFDGNRYLNEKKLPMHGIFQVSPFGYVFPNKKKKETYLEEVAFFDGKMLRSPKAFILINNIFQKNNKVLNPDIQILIDMLDFNPHTSDKKQYYWFDDEQLMVPTGEGWKWPMVEFAPVFNNEGIVTKVLKTQYTGWTSDYKMYTYDEAKILEWWKILCEGE